MEVEKRFVLVGIRIDGHSRQLLDWALVKVAEPGDSVVAVHVVKNPGKRIHKASTHIIIIACVIFPRMYLLKELISCRSRLEKQ